MKGRFKSGREFRRRTSNFSFASNPVTISVGEKIPLPSRYVRNCMSNRLVSRGPKRKKLVSGPSLINFFSVGPPPKNGQNWVKIGSKLTKMVKIW